MKDYPAADPSSGKALHVALTLILVAGLAALIGWVVLLRRELRSTGDELAELRQRPTPIETVEKDNQSLRARVADLESKLATARTDAAAQKPATATTAVPTAPANPMAALAATMNTPAMRAMMAPAQKRMIEMKFAELFSQLQFNPEQRARFIELMTDGQSLSTEAALKLATGNLSPAEQAALREQIKDVEAVKDEKVREFFGDDAKYAAYKQFTEQQTERSQVTALNKNLAQSGEAPLSAEQSTALTSMMYAERKNFPFSQPASRDSANPLAVPTAEAMEVHLREQEQLNTQIANRAGGILTPAQLSNLRQEQAKRLETLKASSEMARQFMGGAQPAAK